MLHKIQGNDIFQPAKHLKVNNNSITDTKEIANTLANTIAYNSSSNHYSSTFQSHKTIGEKYDIRFPPADNEPYTLPKYYYSHRIHRRHKNCTRLFPVDLILFTTKF